MTSLAGMSLTLCIQKKEDKANADGKTIQHLLALTILESCLDVEKNVSVKVASGAMGHRKT